MGREVSQEEEITKYLKILIGTGLLVGYSPVAPGTLSCLLGVLIWYLLFNNRILYIVVASVLFIIGLIVSNVLEKEWGKDPRRIVVDEYVSILLPLFFTPMRILPLAMTFLLFRFFDIVKPPPLKKLESLEGGLGVMIDDLVAGLYTTVVILGLRFTGVVY